MRRISSDLQGLTLDLNGGENVTEECKWKIEKTPAVSYSFQKPRLSMLDIYINNLSVYCPTVSPRVCFCAQIQPDDTAELMNAASQGNLNEIDKYLAHGGNPNVHDEVCSPCLTIKLMPLRLPLTSKLCS